VPGAYGFDIWVFVFLVVPSFASLFECSGWSGRKSKPLACGFYTSELSMSSLRCHLFWQ